MDFLFTKNSVYKTRYFIYTYNDNDIRFVKLKSCRLPDFEEQKSLGTFDYNSDEVSRISLSRTRRNIREIALCNEFEYFVTLTISSELGDRYSLNDCQYKLKKILEIIKILDIFLLQRGIKMGLFIFMDLLPVLMIYILMIMAIIVAIYFLLN